MNLFFKILQTANKDCSALSVFQKDRRPRHTPIQCRRRHDQTAKHRFFAANLGIVNYVRCRGVSVHYFGQIKARTADFFDLSARLKNFRKGNNIERLTLVEQVSIAS